jgi:hypothetical protein
MGPSAEGALRTTYDQLGVLIPRQTALWRRDDGHVFVNEAVINRARQEAFASDAGAPAFGQQLLGRSQNKRQAAALHQVQQDTPQRLAAIERWWERVQAMAWRQATVLQIMEEIEPNMEAALTAHYQVTTHVIGLQQQLCQWLEAWIPDRSETLFASLSTGLEGDFASAGYRRHLHHLATTAREEVERLPADSLENWQESLPDGAFRQALEAFLATYGLYGPIPLETASSRWQETPTTILDAVIPGRMASDVESPQQSRQRRADGAAQVSQELGLFRRRTFEPAFRQMQALVDLLPACRDALVTVVAATRYWALGAAQEAVQDGRLAQAEEVFLLELEELKQMMTGEWSQTDKVQSLVAVRLAEQKRLQLDHG